MTSTPVASIFAASEHVSASLDRRGIRIAALDEAPALDDTLTDMKLRDMGSNAWAIGAALGERKRIIARKPALPLVRHRTTSGRSTSQSGVYNALMAQDSSVRPVWPSALMRRWGGRIPYRTLNAP